MSLPGFGRRVFTEKVHRIVLGMVLCVTGCYAQEYEIGGLIGYGIYRDTRINAPAGNAATGIHNRFAAGAVIGEDLYEHISGEVVYTFQDGDPFITANGKTAIVQGQSHSLTYDVLFHIRKREKKLRPFIAAGLGGKYYRTTGPAPNPQPFPTIATLVNRNQWTFLASIGGGVKYRAARHLLLRADFRDYITPFPTDIFVPAQGGTRRGLFQQFTPMFGASYSF